jgi:signal transduction histidine kinase
VWLHTISSPVIDENGEVTHFNGLVIDVTQQMLAEEARRTLLAFEEIVTSISTRFINLETSHIDDGIQQALKVVGEFTGDDRTYIFCYSDDHSRMDCVYEWCAPGISAEIDRLKDISVEILPWLNRWLLAKEELYIESVADLPAEARADQAELSRQGIQSLLAVPMQHQGRVIGFLGFDSVRQKKTWNRESIALLHIVGESFVNALKRKEAQQTLEQAYQNLELRVDERTRQLQERRKVAEGLRDILSMINTNQPLADVLNFILDRACQLARASGGIIYRLDQEAGLSYPEACSGMPDGFSSLGPFPIVNWGPQKDVLDNKPSILYDFPERLNQALHTAENADPRLLDWARLMVDNFRAYLSFPLFIGSQLYGALSLVYREPRQLTQEEFDLVVTFASQASLAIENTSLRAQAAQAAVTAERSRIARDLHDAVTQTLFASSLIAEVLPVLWDRKPDEARRRLDEVRRLNKAALAEMRTLLLELKPSALLEAEIPDLFRHLCDAFSGRTMVPVHQNLDASIELSGEAKVAFYRIAQEGLNNISKHAEATQVWLTLRRTSPETGSAGIELSLRDDGLGFDPQQISFENLGLGIMHERADSLGAQFILNASPGQGVEITVRLQK